MEAKGVFQDLHQLDCISLVGSSFEPDYGTHVTGYDPFGPLPFGVSSNDLDLYEFKPLEHVNDGGMVVSLNNRYKSFVGWGGSDLSTHMGTVECPIQDPKPMSFFVPDEGSCVTADNRIKKVIMHDETNRVLKEMVEKRGEKMVVYRSDVEREDREAVQGAMAQSP
ncbi:hypothetical protein L6452_39638 [Arctium lappa]|uniref:Uncharacterized protein n=1 Tax=Arctium lappa TaxID=4217 RepID=A0ACB8XTK6_ARCLA|nr:hypothetical protein L6452_39638 [Arctium lappa]